MGSVWEGETGGVMSTGLTGPAAAGEPRAGGVLAWAERTSRGWLAVQTPIARYWNRQCR